MYFHNVEARRLCYKRSRTSDIKAKKNLSVEVALYIRFGVCLNGIYGSLLVRAATEYVYGKRLGGRNGIRAVLGEKECNVRAITRLTIIVVQLCSSRHLGNVVNRAVYSTQAKGCGVASLGQYVDFEDLLLAGERFCSDLDVELEEAHDGVWGGRKGLWAWRFRCADGDAKEVTMPLRGQAAYHPHARR